MVNVRGSLATVSKLTWDHFIKQVYMHVFGHVMLYLYVMFINMYILRSTKRLVVVYEPVLVISGYNYMLYNWNYPNFRKTTGSRICVGAPLVC